MKSPKIMYGYAAFLVICGLVAFAWSGFASNAMTAVYVGGGSALLMVICGLMGAQINKNRTVGMIGIHAGLVLPIMYLLAFGGRAYSAFTTGGEEKRYLAIILSIMAAGSIIAFFMILKARPKPEDRG